MKRRQHDPACRNCCWPFAAAEAAYAATVAVFRRQRDLLLKLIKQAPITQQENNFS
jgi:hypothetical protein